MRSTKLLALAMALALGACSDDTKPVQSDGPQVKKDGVTNVDGPVVAPDTGVLPSMLQTVISALKIPANGTEYGYDYVANAPCTSGTNCKNKLGAIANALVTAGLQGFDFQSNVDAMLKNGTFLLLLELFGKSLTEDPTVGLQAFLGKDKDDPPNPANNFSGTGEFTIDPKSPMDLKLAGKITGGKLAAGPGSLVIVIPTGGTPPQVNVKQCRIEGTVADNPTSAITNGKLYGLIPWTDVDGKIIPEIQKGVDATYKSPSTPTSTKNLMKSLFDADGNGTITVEEIRNSALLKLILAPDVDSTGGSTPDSMSVGLGFSAVKAVIQK